MEKCTTPEGTLMLSKGFEVEMYTGTPEGDIVGLSDKIVAELDGFVREPDSRNVEYTTPPCYRYERSLCDLVRPRIRLRGYLKQLGDYTLIPGSTLSLGEQSASTDRTLVIPTTVTSSRPMGLGLLPPVFTLMWVSVILNCSCRHAVSFGLRHPSI